MTKLTAIVNSVHTCNESLHRLRLQLSELPRIEIECSGQGDIMEFTTILNSVHTSNNS
jgi:hypothetical protein